MSGSFNEDSLIHFVNQLIILVKQNSNQKSNQFNLTFSHSEFMLKPISIKTAFLLMQLVDEQEI